MRKWIKIQNDILHIYFSPYYRGLSKTELEKIAPQSLAHRIKIIAKTSYLRLGKLLSITVTSKDKKLLHNNVWLFAQGQNNMRALEFIQLRWPNSVFVLDKERTDFKDKHFVVPNLRFLGMYVYKFVFIYRHLVALYGDYARHMSPVIFRSIGFYEEWKRVLKLAKPKAIVFANDHNIESRALLLAASELSIPTIYIQHASVSSSFPPLRFGLNLLEGQDALDKYSAIGVIEGQVHLVGMPKFDAYVRLRKTTHTVERIGIPFNLNDDKRMLNDLIENIQKTFPEITLTIRRHPKDKTPNWAQVKFPSVIHSDGQLESAFDFLLKQDFIIAGNSSIHLEATLLNKHALYYNMGDGSFIDDYYGYVKNGLVQRANSLEEIVELIQKVERQPEVLFLRAQYYNAVVGTRDESSSQDLVMQRIAEYLGADETA